MWEMVAKEDVHELGVSDEDTVEIDDHEPGLSREETAQIDEHDLGVTDDEMAEIHKYQPPTTTARHGQATTRDRAKRRRETRDQRRHSGSEHTRQERDDNNMAVTRSEGESEKDESQGV